MSMWWAKDSAIFGPMTGDVSYCINAYETRHNAAIAS